MKWLSKLFATILPRGRGEVDRRRCQKCGGTDLAQLYRGYGDDPMVVCRTCWRTVK